MVFGDYDTTTSEERAIFDKNFDFTTSLASKRTFLGPWFKIIYYSENQEYIRACGEIHRHLDKLIVRAVRERQILGEGKEGQKPRRYCLLDELLAATDDTEQIRWEIMAILAAGRDTTASMLMHTVHNLVRRPDVWSKLLHEVAVLNGNAPDFESLQRMKYVKNVLNESKSQIPLLQGCREHRGRLGDVHCLMYSPLVFLALRVWPSVWLSARLARRDTYLPQGGGPDGKSPCFIGKGQKVWICINAMHRRRENWGPDADEFRPERWAEKGFQPGAAFMPFATGPRICLGQQTAMITAGYALVRLLQACPSLENRDPTPYVERLKIVCDVKGGVVVGRAIP